MMIDGEMEFIALRASRTDIDRRLAAITANLKTRSVRSLLQRRLIQRRALIWVQEAFDLCRIEFQLHPSRCPLIWRCLALKAFFSTSPERRPLRLSIYISSQLSKAHVKVLGSWR